MQDNHHNDGKVGRMIDLENEDDIPEYERPNKSEMRRTALAMQDLARALSELHDSAWVSYKLPEHLLEELKVLKGTEQHGAKKRQLKRVAKLLGEEDVTAAKHAVENAQKQHADVDAAFHKVEQWRDKLVAGNQDVLTDFLGAYTDVNVQELNQLVRNAKQELAKGKSPKSSKLLFKLIRETIA